MKFDGSRNGAHHSGGASTSIVDEKTDAKGPAVRKSLNCETCLPAGTPLGLDSSATLKS
jgi:hypothetical protein